MRQIFLFLFLILSFHVAAQKWIPISDTDVSITGIRDIQPRTFTLFRMEDETMQTLLWQAPDEKQSDLKSSDLIIQVGLPGGVMEQFRIVRYSMMEKELEDAYPNFRTFIGASTTIKGKRIRIDYTEQGFRAVISAMDDDHIYIDHFQRGDKNTRIVYYKKDYKKVPSWGCNVDEEFIRKHAKHTLPSVRVGDCLFRSYRLAQAVTGEYSNYFGAFNASQSGLVLSSIITGINRVNAVYESEVAVRLILVANTTQVFFYDPATDPYTATDAGAMLGQNITTCNNIIGSANYDIGHVFGALGNNGVAYLQSVCGSNKAGGVTTSTQPVNDPFYIDYVAHEMGHQFGGNHTQNNNCNRVAAAAREPGSASTIMGYAGICSPNVQSNSDAYFHAYSLQEMKNFLLAGGASCDNFVPDYNNSAPVVIQQPDYTIPRSTPFALTLNATDPDDDAMLYAWDQMDNEVATMPPVSTNAGGPTFRSIFYTSSPTRYFPNLTTILAGNTANTWEVVPSVSRSMNFRGVVRDIPEGTTGSCNSEEDVLVNTVAAAGPFAITSQNAATTWVEGQSAEVTWDVAGTTANGINCSQVDILLSYNGGQTFSVLLVNAAPNTGSFTISVPAGTTIRGRIMVRAVGNIFFDINNANITINPGSPSFNLTRSPATQTICSGQSKTFTITVEPILGFNNPVTLSVPGLPSGYTADFSVNPVMPGNSSVLTITNVSAMAGTTIQNVNGISGTINKGTTISLTSVLSGNLGTTTLTAPVNNATNVSVLPTFTWSPTTNASGYDLQVARVNDFSDPLIFIQNITGTTYVPVNYLAGGSEFFWRVRPKNECVTGDWSSIFTFFTEACYVYPASGLPIVIPPTASTINSFRQVADRGTITDLDVINLTGTHTWIDDLRFTLFAPNNTNVIIWNRPCDDHDDFNINFNQQAPAGSWPCPPTNGGTYRPSNTLNTFNNLSVTGQWRMQVQDLVNQDGGSLNSWGIKTCVNNFCRLIVDNTFPKGAGSLFDAIQCAQPGDTIRFAAALNNDTIQLGNQNLLMTRDIVIESDISRNLHIMSDSNSALMTVATQTTGQGLRIKGLHLHSTSADIGCIDNQGKLILEDVMLYRNNNTMGSTIFNRPGAVNDFRGNCRIAE